MHCELSDIAGLAAGRRVPDAHEREHLALCPHCRGRLQSERHLSAALRELATELASVQAPPAIEQALLARVQSRRVMPLPSRARAARPFPGRRWLGATAIAASIAALVTTVMLRVAVPVGTPALAQADAAQAPALPEVATPFFPVAAARTAAPGSRGMVRVRVPRSTLAMFGLPYNPNRAADPIKADLLVDNGGVVMAVRFVQ